MIIGTTKLSSRGQVVIPEDIREGLNVGDKLIVIKKDNDIILRKTVSDLALLSEASFAETWLNKEEDEAWKDL